MKIFPSTAALKYQSLFGIFQLVYLKHKRKFLKWQSSFFSIQQNMLANHVSIKNHNHVVHDTTVKRF